MARYTYEDVIIDPKDPRVEIGAEYWFSDCPNALVKRLNNAKAAKKGHLSSVESNNNLPFYDEDSRCWLCIIRKKEMTYTERQAEWVKANNIKVGDKVKVIRKCETEENGWGCTWNIHVMDSAVDKVFKIVNSHYKKGILLRIGIDECWFPYFVLEKVEEPEKKYVPFDLNNEEDRAKLRGAWVRIKGSRRLEQQIVALAINTQLVFLPDVVSVETKELLEGYEFLDGTPCGIVVEDEQ